MDYVHGTHSSACIVEHPFLIQVDITTGELLTQLSYDIAEDGFGVVAMLGDSAEGEVVELRGAEDVEPVEVGVEEVVQRGEEGDKDGGFEEEGDPAAALGLARGGAGAGGASTRGGRGGTLGRHVRRDSWRIEGGGGEREGGG